MDSPTTNTNLVGYRGFRRQINVVRACEEFLAWQRVRRGSAMMEGRVGQARPRAVAGTGRECRGTERRSVSPRSRLGRGIDRR
jgi:hypothetical protein